MRVNRDHDGRDLEVGDPVTLYYGGIANKTYDGQNSRGNVTGFGSVNVQVRLTHSRSADLIGKVVPVPGSNLKYGHVGYVRAADQLAELQREYDAAIQKGKQERAESALFEVIKLATERQIITQEQGRALWVLQNDIPQQGS
ncbi:hypothetical protein [Nocardia sp. R7R-8]|uniref:hypothetical protein n=1 Tax=Nocardia sp. R7R-8 TaxID=3459304 RepID=UPI00403D9219